MAKMLEAYILEIDKFLEKHAFERLLGYVTESKRDRIGRFHRPEDAQRSLLGDVLARYAICKRLGVKNGALAFGANEYGKPLLLEHAGIHFNISHSGSWVACAVDDNPVGIDVELIQPIDFKIAERFFSKDEHAALLAQPDEMKLTYFYMLWTLKESYIKAEGKGLGIPLDSFTMRIEGHDIKVAVGREPGIYSFYQSFPGTDAVCSVCTLDREFRGSTGMGIERFLEESLLYL